MPNDEWITPGNLFRKLYDEFNFDLDVATNGKNNMVPAAFLYCHPWWQDALENDWIVASLTRKPVCWMNPPYSREKIGKFVQKAFEESQKGCTVVGLLRLSSSAAWFEDYVFGKAHEVRFCTHRVHFIDPKTECRTKNSPNFDNIIVVWKPGIPKETKFSMFDW